MRRSPLRLWLPVLAYMGLLFVLSAQPGKDGPSPFPAWIAEAPDWLQHGVAYAGLALITLRATASGRWSHVAWPTLVAAWVVATLYGVFDEWHQSFVPGREQDIRDVLADAAGAAVALGAAWAWGIIKPRS